MVSANVQNVIDHYTRRHAFRQDLFGSQPYANYGYWTRPGQTIEEAAEALTDLVARTAGIGHGDRVLDVGCGYGAGAVSYTQRYQPAYVVGIDITDIRIESGREYVAEHHLSDVISLRLGDATHMDFADASFTRLIAVECAFHFETRRDFMHEAARVLAPGGRLALTDIIPRRGVDPRTYLQGERTANSNVCLDMPANAYDADTYARYLAEAGFSEIRV
ncbi:MAG TPA: class I SAM-dependent methyltransferase, partial [Nevskiaceae bacterium]|nr:class I SAM-dependent methyltransferase [Nevskiaceae bacterium]